ncbi:LRP2-binding protein [Bombina bombina]|uniref:LRP2-binding protein n=1 Tax=Bombina bombina TaxID=8345 RepID=UPI00235B2555|nr:LRP2-binding protein [Bombina bombina]
MKLSSEDLPKRYSGSILDIICQLPDFSQDKKLLGTSGAPEYTRDALLEMAEQYLKLRIKEGDTTANFVLGQLCFEEGWYEDALLYFDKVKLNDCQAMYQIGVMYYDGLGVTTDQVKGVEYMQTVFTSSSSKAKHLKFAVAYNLGRACFEGCGKPYSDIEAERWWLLAADNGNPKASVKAQSILGMFYSRPPTRDLQKAFFWHSEACGNGSLESQGALGVMYLHGHGIRANLQSAVECLKQAAERGNVYAQGHLVSYYYHKKLYTMTTELAKRVVLYDNVDQLAKETDCLAAYITKGIAMATFYLARCLHLGLGIKQDSAAAKKYYTKACFLDADVVAELYLHLIYGKI